MWLLFLWTLFGKAWAKCYFSDYGNIPYKTYSVNIFISSSQYLCQFSVIPNKPFSLESTLMSEFVFYAIFACGQVYIFSLLFLSNTIDFPLSVFFVPFLCFKFGVIFIGFITFVWHSRCSMILLWLPKRFWY